MILRSVVGKLWLTIILLVSLVLILLSLFLSEQIGKTYYEEQQNSLTHLAKKIKNALNVKTLSSTTFFDAVVNVSASFDMQIALIDPNGKIMPLGSTRPPEIPREVKDQIDIDKVLRGEDLSGVIRANLGQDNSLPFFKNDVIYAAVPYMVNNRYAGVILVMQSQDGLSEGDLKQLIFYSALIGIALTTVFAFFLSTRITQPLIQMKKAAEKMAQGEFSTRVHVRSHEKDEIAELGMAFNRMATQLEESINLLSHEKEQLSSILKSMADGVISLNANGKIILTNPPADRLLSFYWSQEGKGQGRELPPSIYEIFEKVVKEEKEHIQDITLEGRTYAVVMAPLYARNQVRGAVAVLRDVTDERRLDKLRKDFVANVSHELRTPLSMLQGYSEALMDDIVDDPEMRRDIAKVINDESQRMGRLVKELLDLAKIESGHIDLKLSDLDVEMFLERVVRKFSNLAREQQITLSSDVAKNLPFVRWDEDKIEQVLTNLISNAIRHTPEGGKVEVRAFWDEEKEFVFLEVEDTGEGIPEEDLPYIFERFYKADKARRRNNSSGTGLGLAIVKQLVQLHQGHVSARSKLGEGTTFTVQLPVIVKEPPKPEEQ